MYTKRFDDWNERSKQLDSLELVGFFREREIWWCALGINIGSEQNGTSATFERSVLVIRKIRKDLLLVIPFTTKIAEHPHRMYSESTGTPSQLLLDQIRTVSSKRLVRKIGLLELSLFRQVIIEIVKLLLDGTKIETPP